MTKIIYTGPHADGVDLLLPGRTVHVLPGTPVEVSDDVAAELTPGGYWAPYAEPATITITTSKKKG